MFTPQNKSHDATLLVSIQEPEGNARNDLPRFEINPLI
jgi:hypothetical protein